MEAQRFERGARKLAEVDGEAGQQVIAALQDVAPDLARYVIEFGFGDIYSRPGLDLRTRELAIERQRRTTGIAKERRRPDRQ